MSQTLNRGEGGKEEPFNALEKEGHYEKVKAGVAKGGGAL